MNEHGADLPEFVVEKLERYDPAQLYAVVEYARGDSAGIPDDLPDDIVSVFALQDESTVSAIGRTAREMLEEYGDAPADEAGAPDAPGSDATDAAASDRPGGEATAAESDAGPGAHGTPGATETAAGASNDAAPTTGYEGMAQAFLDRAAERIGHEKAVSLARQVERLDVDDGGRVQSIHGSDQIVVEHLADRYMQYMGMAARNEFADAAAEFDVETPVNVDMTFN